MKGDEIDKIRERAQFLRFNIKKWNHEYFVLDAPTVEDDVYDSYINELIDIENKFRNLFSEEELRSSPTNFVGGRATNKFKKVVHSEPMLSLNKAYTIDDLRRFESNILKFTRGNEIDFYVEPKVDGISISLIYKNGFLFRGLTRGDGEIGEDITHNILVIDSIPKKINYSNDLEVRGEVFISKKDFELVKEEAKKEKLKLTNPRNLASGSLRQLDPEKARRRHLSSVFFSIVNPKSHNLFFYSKTLDFLKKNGFQIQEFGKSCKNIEECFEILKNLKEIENNLSYFVDGAVIKLNNLDFYKNVGKTAKFPHHSIAFKYKEKTAITKIEDIFITIGRSGIVTYNAKLRPVNLSGTTITFSTLHNWNFVKNLGINIGDVVEIKKAGEIIPRVIRVLKKVNSGTVQKAQHCPNCCSTLVEKEELVDQFCINKNCRIKNIRKIIHFCSKNAMNINSLAEKNIILFFEKGWVKKISDIYKLKKFKEEIMRLPNKGEKSTKIIFDAIEESKKNPLWRMINALGIKHIGVTKAKFLEQKCKDFRELISLNFDFLINEKNFGEKITRELKKFFGNLRNIQEFNELINLGLNLKSQEKKVFNTEKYLNKKFVITGKHIINRRKMEELILLKGGQISSSVTSKTDFLIVGENPGSKLKQAIDFNTKLISSQEFIKEFSINE